MAHNNLPMTFATWVNDLTRTVPDWNVTVGDTGGWSSSDNQIYYYPTIPTKIERELDDFFSRFWNDRGKPVVLDGSNLPKSNIYEDDSGMHIECLIPFVSKEDLQVTLDPVMNLIRLEVESHQDEIDGREYHLREISRTSFKRTIQLDRRFDIKRAEAVFEDSVLKIDVPYGEDSERKRLTIK